MLLGKSLMVPKNTFTGPLRRTLTMIGDLGSVGDTGDR